MLAISLALCCSIEPNKVNEPCARLFYVRLVFLHFERKLSKQECLEGSHDTAVNSQI